MDSRTILSLPPILDTVLRHLSRPLDRYSLLTALRLDTAVSRSTHDRRDLWSDLHNVLRDLQQDLEAFRMKMVTPLNEVCLIVVQTMDLPLIVGLNPKVSSCRSRVVEVAYYFSNFTRYLNYFSNMRRVLFDNLRVKYPKLRLTTSINMLTKPTTVHRVLNLLTASYQTPSFCYMIYRFDATSSSQLPRRMPRWQPVIKHRMPFLNEAIFRMPRHFHRYHARDYRRWSLAIQVDEKEVANVQRNQRLCNTTRVPLGFVAFTKKISMHAILRMFRHRLSRRNYTFRHFMDRLRDEIAGYQSLCEHASICKDDYRRTFSPAHVVSMMDGPYPFALQFQFPRHVYAFSEVTADDYALVTKHVVLPKRLSEVARHMDFYLLDTTVLEHKDVLFALLTFDRWSHDQRQTRLINRLASGPICTKYLYQLTNFIFCQMPIYRSFKVYSPSADRMSTHELRRTRYEGYFDLCRLNVECLVALVKSGFRVDDHMQEYRWQSFRFDDFLYNRCLEI